MKKTSEKGSVVEHNFTVLRKNRTGKALGKGIGDHEVGQWILMDVFIGTTLHGVLFSFKNSLLKCTEVQTGNITV